MGRHLPFFILEEAMVAEMEAEDESLAIDCPVLLTERLVLRPPHVDDIPELTQLANNRRVAEMLARMPHPYGEAEARAFLAMSEQTRTAGCVYAVTLAESGAFIGCASRLMGEISDRMPETLQRASDVRHLWEEQSCDRQ